MESCPPCLPAPYAEPLSLPTYRILARAVLVEAVKKPDSGCQGPNPARPKFSWILGCASGSQEGACQCRPKESRVGDPGMCQGPGSHLFSFATLTQTCLRDRRKGKGRELEQQRLQQSRDRGPSLTHLHPWHHRVWGRPGWSQVCNLLCLVCSEIY